MKISHGPEKEKLNLKDHKISLAEAARLDWGVMQTRLDRRHDYGEDRWIGYAPLGERLYCVVFVERDGGKRIISLRKANNREVKRYEAKK